MRLRPTGASGPDATSAGVGCTPLCFLSGFLPLTSTWPSVWCGSPAPHCPPPHRATRPESCSTSAWVASQCPWSVVCVRSRDTAASAFARVTAEPSTVSTASTRPAGRAQAPPLASAAARQRFPPATANPRAPISGGAPLTAGRASEAGRACPPRREPPLLASPSAKPGPAVRPGRASCSSLIRGNSSRFLVTKGPCAGPLLTYVCSTYFKVDTVHHLILLRMFLCHRQSEFYYSSIQESFLLFVLFCNLSNPSQYQCQKMFFYIVYSKFLSFTSQH